MQRFDAYVWTTLLAALLISACAEPRAARDSSAQDEVEVVAHEDEQRVDVMVGDQLFTSYIYSDTLDVLKKPVLYPVNTALGTEVTRAYPLTRRAGERVDHPHHIGLWLNYGDVNGLDFWNNSNAVSAEEAEHMGTIEHRQIRSVESGDGAGALEVTTEWLNPDGDALLREDTRFVFRAPSEQVRTIDRITELTALDERVDFDDNKEGMIALRVRRELEMPADDPIYVTDAQGEPREDPVLNNEGVTGRYSNSEGVEGYPDVWGQRAKWLALSGEVKRKPVTIAILDHPENVGYPTYWHARDYGLFSANPLGQRVFSEGGEELNFSLAPGESTTFRHRVVIVSGPPSEADIESTYQEWEEQAL